MNSDVKKYFRECRYLFASYGKAEKAYLNKIKNNLILENNNITYDEIVERFGSPKDIIVDYYDQHDIYTLIKRARITKILRNILIVFLVAILVFLAYKTYIYQKTYEEVQNSTNGYFEEVIE